MQLSHLDHIYPCHQFLWIHLHQSILWLNQVFLDIRTWCTDFSRIFHQLLLIYTALRFLSFVSIFEEYNTLEAKSNWEYIWHNTWTHINKFLIVHYLNLNSWIICSDMLMTGSDRNRTHFWRTINVYECLKEMQSKLEMVSIYDSYIGNSLSVLWNNNRLTAMFGNFFLKFIDVIGGTVAPTGVIHKTLAISFLLIPSDWKSNSDIWTKWCVPTTIHKGFTSVATWSSFTILKPSPTIY